MPALSRKKLTISSIALFLLLGSICYLALFKYGSRISQELLVQVFEEKSEGKYSMSFDEFDISLLHSRLDLTNFSIRPNYNQDGSLYDSTRAVYFVSIPILSIDLHSISDIYFQKTLSFQNIEITDPSVKMERLKKGDKKQSLSLEAGDLYKLIDDYLLEFSMDSLKINNASLGYHSKIQENGLRLLIDKVYFTLQNFAIDQTSQNGQFLFSGGFSLHLTDQFFLLSDSLHYASFEKLSLSTSKSTISVKNLTVSQREDKIYQPKSGLNQYQIQVPEILLEGVNFEEAYENNTLALKHVLIQKPSFNIRQRNQASKESSNDIPLLLSRLFNEIEVDRMSIEHANSSFQVDYGDKNQAFRFKNSNLLIEEFKLDSGNTAGLLSSRVFEHISLTSDDNQIVFADSSHSIDFHHLQFSSKDSTVSIEDFDITPINLEGKKNRFDAQLKSITIDGFDLNSLILNRHLKLTALSLNEPTGEFNVRLNTQKNEQLSVGLGLVQMKEFNVNNGTLALKAGDLSTRVAELFTSVHQINWEPGKNQNLADIFKLGGLRIKDYHVSNNEFELDIAEVSASDHWSELIMKGIDAQVDHQQHPLKSKKLKITGLDTYGLLSNDKIHFDQLLIDQPVLKLMKTNAGNSDISKQLHKASFNEIKVKQGEISFLNTEEKPTIQLSGFSSSISHFRYDSIMDEYFADPTISMDSATLEIDKIDHLVTLKKINIDALDSSLFIGNLKFLPGRNATNKFDISGDSLDLAGIDIHDLINNQRLDFALGSFSDSRFDISVIDSSNSKRPSIPVAFGKFQLRKSSWNFKKTDLFNFQSQLDLTISDLDGNEEDWWKSCSYTLAGNSLEFVNSDLDEPLRIGEYKINTLSGLVSLKDITASKPKVFDATFPSIDLLGVQFDSLLGKQKICLDSISIIQPKLTITINQNDSSSKGQMAPKLDIGHLSLENADIQLKLKSDTGTDTLNLRSFNFSMNQFNNSIPENANPLTMMESFRFDGSDLSYELPGDMFTLRAKRYQYNSTGSQISLKRFRVEPKYNRGEFQRKLTYQSDWIDLEVQQMTLNDVSLDALRRGEIRIGAIDLSKMSLDTHRDKRLPLEKGIYKPLPQTALRSVAMPIKIDTVRFDKSFITHSEFSEEGTSPGVIFFRNLGGIITNITNDEIAIDNNSKMTLYVTGSIMNTGDIMVQSMFDYRDSLDRYTLRGTVGEMDLTELNRFLENTASVRIRDGRNKSLSFAFEANEDYAFGSMKFYYRDLKINVLDAETHQRKGHGASIKSFFANTFVVNSKNPHFLFVRDGDIYMERDKSKSVFSYWGKSLVSGLVSSIGAKNNKKKLKALAEKIRQGINLSDEKPSAD
ncbi:MAG: hypothetical protein JXR10_17470 [Cyclobacteriaceae bacterium]